MSVDMVGINFLLTMSFIVTKLILLNETINKTKEIYIYFLFCRLFYILCKFGAY